MKTSTAVVLHPLPAGESVCPANVFEHRSLTFPRQKKDSVLSGTVNVHA